MAAAVPPEGRDERWDDLTARARIRDAALAQFAERGYAGTTIRGIAEAAEVSPALVQHHFRTKDALRAACDEYVIEFIHRQHGVDSVYRAAPARLRYLARALSDNSPAAGALFDDLVILAGERLGEDRGDVKARAAVLTAMQLGVLVLRDHLARALEVDPISPDGLPVVGTAMLDLLGPTAGQWERE
ncbi:TetR/AcrR family transcriptional regulator [Amycolatopsis nigrescens]|uniref:TetR/AcrR family transcriptional regulator n=1 Tax=Amycolatopsis nigrescens TaxID=381445 RepID=UPI00039D12D3|nr:TetR/AcrR family transcriptional regulator [Amycolatopsis nigrescens]